MFPYFSIYFDVFSFSMFHVQIVHEKNRFSSNYVLTSWLERRKFVMFTKYKSKQHVDQKTYINECENA